MANLKNLATSTVLTAPSPATSGTSLVVQSGEGARFPAASFYAIAHPDGTLPDVSNAEIVLVTAVSTDTFTITRAQLSTTAKSISVAWRISNPFLKEDYDNKQDLNTNLTTIAGLTPTTDNFMVASGSAWASRTPTQARTHMGLGSIALLSTIAESNITLSDVTTNNASTSNHGFLKKLSNSATDFMDGTGAWDTIKDSDLSTSNITTNDVSTTKHGFTPIAPNNAQKVLGGLGTWQNQLYGEAGRTLLASTSATITVSSLPARKYLRISYFLIPSGGTINPTIQFNGDTAANYASRLNTNGGADSTPISQTANYIDVAAAQTLMMWGQIDIINFTGQDKVSIGVSTTNGATGSATAPTRREFVQKWTGSAQISSIVVTSNGSGVFAIGSEIIVSGHD